MKLLITGTSSGMGRWLAGHYGAQGHDVWGIARRDQSDFVAAQKQRSQSFRSTRADISKWNELETAARAIEGEWGRLDGLICCAGIQGPLGPAMNISAAAWHESLSINL